MAFIQPALTARTKVGIAIEAVAGTFAAPFFWLPVSSAKVENDRKIYPDKSYRGRASETYGHYRLVATGLAEYTGPLYPDSTTPLFLSAFGHDKITAGVGFAAASDLSGAIIATALTATLDSGAGFRVGENIKISDGVNTEYRKLTVVAGAVLTWAGGLAHGYADETPVVASPDSIAGSIAKGDVAVSLLAGQGANYTVNMAVLVGTGNNQEGNIVKSVATDALTFWLPFRFAHDSANPAQNQVQGNSLHEFRLAPNDRVDATYGGNSGIPAGNTEVPHLSILDNFKATKKEVVGATVEELNIKWSGETEVTYTVKLRGMPVIDSADATPSAFTKKAPFTGWQAGLLTSIVSGALAIDATVQDMDVTITRKVEPIFGGNNQDGPVGIIATVMGVKGKITAVFSTAAYDAYDVGDPVSLGLALAGVARGENDAHVASGLLLEMPNTVIVKAPIERGKDYVQVALDFESDDDLNANGADGPIIAWLTNSLSVLA
jgi:hypothetical protein